MDSTNKLLADRGFVIFSDDEHYERGLIEQYLKADPVVQNIIFVYSEKNDVHENWQAWLEQFGKTLLVVPFEQYDRIEHAGRIEALDLNRTLMIAKDLRFMEKRLDPRHENMQTKHQCYKKIIIDAYPYEVQKYRVYYPYSFFNKEILGYKHSYAIERDIENFREGVQIRNPFDIGEIVQKVAPVTFLNYNRLFRFKIIEQVRNVTTEQQAGYETLKAGLFEQYAAGKIGDKRLIASLQKYAASICPGYSIPADLKKLYAMRNDEEILVCHTDLPVDINVLMPELREMIEFENNYVRALFQAVNRWD